VILLRGVTRSKRMALRWLRKAAENGLAESCLAIANVMYADQPYAREVARVEEASEVATSAWTTQGHDVPPDVLTSVVYWLRKGGVTEQCEIFQELHQMRWEVLEGARWCCNDTCEVVDHLKNFKVCPQCKTARYCGDACQKQDWTTGGHKATCGTFESKTRRRRPDVG